MAKRAERIEFRANLSIRLSVLGALLFWVLVAALSVTATHPATHALAAVAFFIVFFVGFVAHFWNMRYVVSEYGVTYRGATEFRHVDWEDIVRVQDSELPLGGWHVTTKTGCGLNLNRFVSGHERLRDLIVARAGLFPMV